jgi:N utilization substance protein B
MATTPTSPKRREERLALSAARLAAVQALYQMEMTGADWREVVREFDDHRLGAEIEGVQYREADPAHFKATVEGAVADQSRIDKLTDTALVATWPLGRIDAILRAVFRAAGQELTARADIPAKVVIGEYVDVAKAFFEAGREAKFVNAVLDHMARDARPEQMGS